MSSGHLSEHGAGLFAARVLRPVWWWSPSKIGNSPNSTGTVYVEKRRECPSWLSGRERELWMAKHGR